ncbi:hypothetical protein RFI_19181 [Reticulomyxa filosa]|uniref:Uncharacterized protein n=1 Tax=Reticulomyxa filosa TaxID=46433 RepID=X6MW94_RETFI|nr:hypothetical protein RFI_19181 [Reticulomyxa filosa]|eukprot:ETO18109.1 hypothetical protein RFI_19181 [Reticulomyxa filosa]
MSTKTPRKLNIIQEKQLESFKHQANVTDDDAAILFLELSHWDVDEAINAWLEEQTGQKQANARQRRISKGPVWEMQQFSQSLQFFLKKIKIFSNAKKKKQQKKKRYH